MKDKLGRFFTIIGFSVVLLNVFALAVLFLVFLLSLIFHLFF